MAASTNTATINALATQVMLNLPKLYGPNGFNGPGSPPADLVASLEQLETAVVDPALLTSGQSVSSVEEQTISDLNNFSNLVQKELAASNGPIGNIGREEIAFFVVPQFPVASASLVADSKQFTAGAASPPVTIVNPPPPPASGVEQYLVTNTTTGVSDWENGQFYSGPVADLKNQFVTYTTDSLNITATKPNNFIHTGSGNDAISVTEFSEAGGGTNVLDGGSGSNFLVGGSLFKNNDTFFVDDRTPAADIWSTVSNFHTGDSATIWGVTLSDFNLAWMDNQGATGYTGLTLHETAAGKPTASLTLVGFSSADLTNGKLTVSYGTSPATGGMAGSSYMLIHGN